MLGIRDQVACACGWSGKKQDCARSCMDTVAARAEREAGAPCKGGAKMKIFYPTLSNGLLSSDEITAREKRLIRKRRRILRNILSCPPEAGS